jgi:focal adhesion kinase 1
VWKIELRVRFIPKSIEEFIERDKISANFYFNQVKDDFIQAYTSNIEQDVAVQLCCLSIRHFYKDTKSSSSDKKQHLDYIEKEIGFSNFLPLSVISGIKLKNLRKLVQSHYKKTNTLSESEIILTYFQLLSTINFEFEHEMWSVTLGQWNIAIDLIVGFKTGMTPNTTSQIMTRF